MPMTSWKYSFTFFLSFCNKEANRKGTHLLVTMQTYLNYKPVMIQVCKLTPSNILPFPPQSIALLSLSNHPFVLWSIPEQYLLMTMTFSDDSRADKLIIGLLSFPILLPHFYKTGILKKTPSTCTALTGSFSLPCEAEPPADWRKMMLTWTVVSCPYKSTLMSTLYQGKHCAANIIFMSKRFVADSAI